MTEGKAKEGYYLIRVSARAGPSESASGEATFVLSCISKLSAVHHVLKRQASGVWMLNGTQPLPADCVSLPDVLAYFMEQRPKISFVLRSYVRRPPVYRLARYDAFALKRSVTALKRNFTCSYDCAMLAMPPLATRTTRPGCPHLWPRPCADRSTRAGDVLHQLCPVAIYPRAARQRPPPIPQV
jgi:hypothetical protein